MTGVTEPPHVAAASAPVHATEHLSTTIWRPLVAAVRAFEEVPSVVSITSAKARVPLFSTETVRVIESPGAPAVISLTVWFVSEPLSCKTTVPAGTTWLVELPSVA